MLGGGDVVEPLQVRKVGEGAEVKKKTASLVPRCASGPTPSISSLLCCPWANSSTCCAARRCSCRACRSRWPMKNPRHPDLAVQGADRLPGADPDSRSGDPDVRRRRLRRRQQRQLRRRRGASWCVAFTEDGSPVRESYVNPHPHQRRGTRESGLRDGLFPGGQSFIDLHSLLPKGVKLMPEDVFARQLRAERQVLDPSSRARSRSA